MTGPIANPVFYANEKSSALLKVTLTDETGGVPATVSDIKATLYDVTTGSILNSRNAVSILNTGGGDYDAGTGILLFTLTPGDNALQNASTAPESYELHRLLIVTYYGGGGKYNVAEFDIQVKSIATLS